MARRNRLVLLKATGERRGWFTGSFNDLDFDLRRLRIGGKRVFQVNVWKNGRIIEKKYFPYQLYAREYIDTCALKSKPN